jgi:hypothetical protein
VWTERGFNKIKKKRKIKMKNAGVTIEAISKNTGISIERLKTLTLKELDNLVDLYIAREKAANAYECFLIIRHWN